MFCSCCYYGIVVAVGLSKFLLLCFLLLLLFMSKPITVELEVEPLYLIWVVTKTSISLFQRVTLKNHASGEEKILFLNSAQEKDKTHFMDQETGVEMELEDNMPLLEWLANNYKNFGAALEIITDRSQEGSQYVRGFGGIGGMLRYTVDFQVIN